MPVLQKLCRRSRVVWWIGSGVTITLLTIAIYFEMQRVQVGKLFLFALPGEAPATLGEIVDAEESARTLFIPAVLSPVIFGTAFALAVPALRARNRFRKLPWWLIALFLIACLADFATTMRFFQTAGVDHELHPGIRLFGYAYGRSVGPALGKVVQIVGLLALAALLGRWGACLIGVATVLFLAAATYNFLQA